MKPIDGIKFTQADAGKTFEFVVSEVVPGDGGKLAGVTYDEATHKVEIAVSLKDGISLDVATYVDGKLVESGTRTDWRLSRIPTHRQIRNMPRRTSV